ncbi:MAG: hypothetical protein JRI55_40675, partial [Deltaproteobacteria bacterium]|nr:hypothetical protein [Deltaproteobacteria bacterium]
MRRVLFAGTGGDGGRHHLRPARPQEGGQDHRQPGRLRRRVVLANCGTIVPERIEDYLAADGYKALKSVLEANDPAATIKEISDAGLRGRGGAGFPTGMKWKFARGYENNKKYVVCNADEGDPGAFMDRTTLESDPHAVLEGMAIGAFATCA